MIDNGVATAATTMLSPLVPVCGVGVAESVTFAVNAYVPAVVGVPLIVPAPEIVSPDGSVPVLMERVSGATPPVAATDWL